MFVVKSCGREVTAERENRPTRSNGRVTKLTTSTDFRFVVFCFRVLFFVAVFGFRCFNAISVVFYFPIFSSPIPIRLRPLCCCRCHRRPNLNRFGLDSTPELSSNFFLYYGFSLTSISDYLSAFSIIFISQYANEQDDHIIIML